MQIIQNPVSRGLAVYKQSLILNTRVDKAYFVISVTYSFWHLFVYFLESRRIYVHFFFFNALFIKSLAKEFGSFRFSHVVGARKESEER